MSSSELAVRVSNLSKCYQVYDRPEDRLKAYVLPRLPRLPGLGSLRGKSWSTEFWALRDVSFELARGETLGIVGRNGSGKSTLLQVVCGTMAPTSGSVEVQGRIGALLELGAGFDPEFTGLENVFLGASLYGLSPAEIDARIDSIVAFADIGEFIERPVKTYSSGMYVRLAFALMAHIDADVLIIDEALAVGDAFFVQKCMRFLRGFMERGTLLFVSHDLGTISSLSDRALLLEEGRVAIQGRPKVVLERYLAALCDAEAEPVGNSVRSTEESGSAVDRSGSGDPGIAFGGRDRYQVIRAQQHSSGFGTGQARVLSVMLQDDAGHELEWIPGGVAVNLQIVCRVHDSIELPIVGFELKNRLGQSVFGDNTFLEYQYDTPAVTAGGEVEANFAFRMPFLPVGDYMFSVAIAEGSQDTHVQHHWLHEALMIRSHMSSVTFGLIGVPMTSVRLVAR